MTIVIFILILLVCVIVHEWGHFIVAKKSGMLVEEFGFGIPPKLFSWGKGETKYSINALPIGGFVKIAGENGPEDKTPKDRQFDSKPWYIKTAVLVAGVICNALLALILFTVAYTIGMPAVTENGTPTITTIVLGSPASVAGLAVGDTVQSVSVNNLIIEPFSTEQIHNAIVKDNGPVEINYIHNKIKNNVILTPKETGGSMMIGLGIESIGVVKQPLDQAFVSALHQISGLTHAILSTLGGLIRGIFVGHPSTSGLMGPVGLAKEVGSAATFGLIYLLAFTATISLNLAILNIMPFPALDGGRLIVVWGEALTGRKFSKNTVGIIHTVGFLILILLMVVLTVGDIKRVL